MNTETKTCPKCGKKMILEFSVVITAGYPARYGRFWWCACGHTEDGSVYLEKTVHQMRLERWERANAEETHQVKVSGTPKDCPRCGKGMRTVFEFRSGPFGPVDFLWCEGCGHMMPQKSR